LAEPDEVVISTITRLLVRGAFDLGDLGVHSLKGIAQPVQAWRVHALHRPEGRFEAAQGALR
jgi:class 3 adenylate cyclase